MFPFRLKPHAGAIDLCGETQLQDTQLEPELQDTQLEPDEPELQDTQLESLDPPELDTMQGAAQIDTLDARVALTLSL